MERRVRVRNLNSCPHYSPIRASRRAHRRESMRIFHRPSLQALTVLGMVAAFAIFPPFLVNSEFSYVLRLLGLVGLYMLLALGINIVVGFLGLLDLGFMAFYAIGAYTMAL